MQVTDVRIKKLDPEKPGSIKAFASITLDNEFCVHDLTVTEGPARTYVNMPSKRKGDKLLDTAHPLTSELRNAITEAVLEAYKREE